MTFEEYISDLWDDYTIQNEQSLENPSKFIYHTVLALGARNVLEAGCNVGNNLRDFPKTFDVEGFDLSEYAIDKCRKQYPEFKFKLGSIAKIPYPDSSFDLVFTRAVLIHIKSNEVKQVMNELLRVSKKWIFNIEFFGENEDMIHWKRGDNLLWYRNMKKRWSDFQVELISDVEIPIDLDINKVRFTLVRKMV